VQEDDVKVEQTNTTEEKENVKEENTLKEEKENKKGIFKKKNKDEEHIKELEDSLAVLNDKYLRLQAEYMNFRTRSAQDVEKMFKYSNEELATNLLPILDNFERAIKMDDNDLSDEVSKFLAGFKMIYSSFITVLNNIGITEIDCWGKEFDPHVAEAVITESDTTKPENVVLEVLQKGYMYKDKVIRPAMVKVNK